MARKHIPILFSPAMVRALLAGRKTQTRRVCKHQHWSHSQLTDVNKNKILYSVDKNVSSPYGKHGDILWVRETWVWEGETSYTDLSPIGNFWYRADAHPEFGPARWKPSIFMPKEAARIFLKVTDVRVERLTDITEADAIAEGILPPYGSINQYHNYLMGINSEVTACDSYCTLWKSINGPDSWDANPWVWVVSFKKVSKPDNF